MPRFPLGARKWIGVSLDAIARRKTAEPVEVDGHLLGPGICHIGEPITPMCTRVKD